MNFDRFYNYKGLELKDYGPYPFVFDLKEITEKNNYYRVVLWTGEHLQLTLMSIPVNDDIGLEVHDVDQFIYLEEGKALVNMGFNKDNLNLKEVIDDGYGIVIPAGTYHNVTNMGNKDLKLYSIYAPSNDKKNVIQKTKLDKE